MGNRSPLRPPDDLQDAIHCWHIVPIKPNEIKEEIKLMEAVLIADKPIENPNI